MDRYWELGVEAAMFAERLRELRKQRRLTQLRLAEILQVSPRVYNRWERGVAKPHFDTVVKIADILQVSLDELAGRTESSTEPAIRNPQLRLLCQQADLLPDEDQRALVILMDSLVKKTKLAKVLAG